MKNNNETHAQSPKELLQDLQTLVHDAEKLASDSVGDYTAEAVEALRVRYAAAQARMSELYDNARTKVVAGAQCTDKAIRENPYQALAIAVGAGLLVGVLLGRRSS